jgi:hypothetical protein
MSQSGFSFFGCRCTFLLNIRWTACAFMASDAWEWGYQSKLNLSWWRLWRIMSRLARPTAPAKAFVASRLPQ